MDPMESKPHVESNDGLSESTKDTDSHRRGLYDAFDDRNVWCFGIHSL